MPEALLAACRCPHVCAGCPDDEYPPEIGGAGGDVHVRGADGRGLRVIPGGKNLSRRGHARRKLGILLAIVAVLAVGLAVLWRPILVGLGGLLTIEDAPVHADYLYVLTGDVNRRPFHAAKLYHAGMAPRVLIADGWDSPAKGMGQEAEPTDVNVLIMRGLGVPDSAITVIPFPGGVTSTRDEGRALRAHLEQNPAERVIVVTTAHHTRRARWTLRRELRGLPVELRMAAAPQERFDASNWWQNEEGFVDYINEYLRLLHTWLRG